MVEILKNGIIRVFILAFAIFWVYFTMVLRYFFIPISVNLSFYIGGFIVIIGMIFNFSVMSSNGFKMPVILPPILKKYIIFKNDKLHFYVFNRKQLKNVNFPSLSDNIFISPVLLGHGGVVSLGDLFIALGLIVFTIGAFS